MEKREEAFLRQMVLPPELGEKYTIAEIVDVNEFKLTAVVISLGDGKKYILKRAKTGQPQNLLGEAQVLEQLQGETGFPRLVSYDNSGGWETLIRQYLAGWTLEEVVGQNGVMNEQQTRDTLLAVCRIVENLHKKYPPIIHRDIKPQNIIVMPGNQYYFCDMGSARRFHAERETDTVFVGSQISAAPEQFGYRQTDARSDIYALGVLGFFLLTGSYEIPEEPGTISRPLFRVLKRCTAFDPKARYDSVGRLIQGILGTVVKKRRLRSLLATGAILLLLGGAADLSYHPPISFTEPLIEAAVRFQLDIPEGEAIYQEDLDRITELYVCGTELLNSKMDHYGNYGFHHLGTAENLTQGTIQDLSDLKKMKNLKRLMLDNQKISDISALEGLPLIELSLSGNLISDIDILSQFDNLHKLELDENKIVDLSPLLGLSNLEYLSLGLNSIPDVAPLATLTGLSELHVSHMQVYGISQLCKLTGLVQLSVSNCTYEEVVQLCQLKNLRRFLVFNSQIKDYNCFAELPNLQFLNVTGGRILSEEGKEKLKNVEIWM